MRDAVRALVSGATGFIGANLVSALRRRGDDVVAVVRRPVVSMDPGIRVITADLLNPMSLDAVEDRCGRLDAIFHLAAAMPDQLGLTASDYMMANGQATERYVRIARAAGASHFIYISSLSIIGKPVNLPITERHPAAPASAYAAGKLAGELACEQARLNGTIAATSLRITSPYGPGMRPSTVLPRFAQQALHGETLHWFGSGSRAQDFIHIDDVVSACLLATATANPGVYNIGTGQPITMRALAALIAAAVPGVEATADARPDQQDGMVWQVDISAAQKSLGFSPKVDLATGIAAFINDLRSPSSAGAWWRPAEQKP